MMKKLWMFVAVLAVTGIASAELLEDGGFEVGLPVWENGQAGAWDQFGTTVGGDAFSGISWYYGGSQVIAEPWEARSGDKYLRLGNFAPSWAYASWGWAQLGQILPATPGTEYTLTAYFMDDRGFWGDTGTCNATLKMEWLTNGGTNNVGTSRQDVEISSDWNDGWQAVTLTATPTVGPPVDTMKVFVSTSYDWTQDHSFVRVDDVTLCTSTPTATQPDPADGATVAATCQAALSWQTCSAGTFDVYLAEGTPNPDPNFPAYVFDPGDEIATGVTTDTVAVTLANNTDYVWRVDGAAAGAVWSFSTGDAVPEVDAGSAQYLVLDPTATASLDGTLVCDDGNSAVSYLWTIPEPNAIASPTSLVTTATISAAGSYTFTLTATDAAGDGTDTVKVNVYDDACAAALADPADYTALFDGDITGDCLVDLNDFAAMAIDWLDCASAKLGCLP